MPAEEEEPPPEEEDEEEYLEVYRDPGRSYMSADADADADGTELEDLLE